MWGWIVRRRNRAARPSSLKQQLTSALLNCGAFSPQEVPWMVDLLTSRDSSGEQNAIASVIRSGGLLSKDDLRALGLRTNMKIGKRFVGSLVGDDIRGAMDALTIEVGHAVATDSARRQLEQFRAIGVRHVIFGGPDDERATDMERRLDGGRLSLQEAEDLLEAHSRDIVRSVFQADLSQ